MTARNSSVLYKDVLQISKSSFPLDLLEKALYNEDEKKISNMLICLKNNGVEMEVLR